MTLPGSLTLRAGDDLHFRAPRSFTSTSGGFTAFVDDAQDDGGLGGLGSLDGTLTVATTIRLNGNLDADTLNGSGGNDIADGQWRQRHAAPASAAPTCSMAASAATTMAGGLGDDTYVVDNASTSWSKRRSKASIPCRPA